MQITNHSQNYHRSLSIQSDEGVVADYGTRSPTGFAESMKGTDIPDCNLLCRRGSPSSDSSEDDEIDMTIYHNRVTSFCQWPVSYIAPSALASSGFYYTGISDRVRCVACGGVVDHWTRGDDPATEHKRHFPHCSMAKLSSSSQPASIIPPVTQSTAVGEDVCGLYFTLRSTPPSDPVAVEGPAEPSMVQYKDRFATFADWPDDKTQRPKDLAMAGLFFTGLDDQVKCFYCGQRLERWDPQDEPWIEHARWYPNCTYLIEQKGQHFIDQVQDQLSTSHSSGSEEMPFSTSSASSQESGFSESAMSDEDDMEECIVARALQRNCNQNFILKALQERRKDISFDRFRTVEELLAAAGEIEMRERLSKELLEETKAEEKALRSQPLTKEADVLIQENQRLLEERRCRVCLDKERQVLFKPCGHFAACNMCASKLQTCPICRTRISERTRGYLS